MNSKKIVEIIRNAPAGELDAYFDAAMERKRELYPNWWMQYVALPLDQPEICRQTAEEAIQYLKMFATDGQMDAGCVK